MIWKCHILGLEFIPQFWTISREARPSYGYLLTGVEQEYAQVGGAHEDKPLLLLLAVYSKHSHFKPSAKSLQSYCTESLKYDVQNSVNLIITVQTWLIIRALRDFRKLSWFYNHNLSEQDAHCPVQRMCTSTCSQRTQAFNLS